jgi:hypothetical protein
MLHVLLTNEGEFREVTEYLRTKGAKVGVIGPAHGAYLPSKLQIVKSMFSRRSPSLRGLWAAEDRLVVVGWQALRVMAMIRLGLTPRPAKMVVLALYIHSARIRSIVNVIIRTLRFPGLSFFTNSQKESDELINESRIPSNDVCYSLWREDLDGGVAESDVADGEYVFSGGYTNRDYDLLLRAMSGVDAPLVIVASAMNKIDESALSDTTKVHCDLPEADFERLLAKARVVVLALKSQGDGCGQSVLLRVLRNGKPLIMTRHESVVAYVGPDYPGLVPFDDEIAMKAAIRRVLGDDAFRQQLASEIQDAQRRLDRRGNPGSEVMQFLLA